MLTTLESKELRDTYRPRLQYGATKTAKDDDSAISSSELGKSLTKAQAWWEEQAQG